LTPYPYHGTFMNMKPKHPTVTIQLLGQDGNAFSILGRVNIAMKRNGIHDQWSEFHAEATSGNYDNLIMTVMRWFSTDYNSSESNCDNCGINIDNYDGVMDICDDCYDALPEAEPAGSWVKVGK